MKNSIIKEFAKYIYDLSIRNKDDKDKYNQLMSIYNKVNSFDTDFALISYVNSHKNLSILYKEYKNENVIYFDIKKEIHSLAKKYYLICEKSKAKEDIDRYKIIKSVYDTINLEGVTSYESVINSISNGEIKSKLTDILNNNMLNALMTNNVKGHLPYSESIASIIKEKDTHLEYKNLSFLIEDRNINMYNESKIFYQEDIYKCKILDNSVVKTMYEENVLNDLEINYLREIGYEMKDNPYLFLYLPISRLNKKTIDKYHEYIPYIDETINKARELYDEAKDIDKMFSSTKIDKNKLDKLFMFLSFYVSNTLSIKDDFNYDGLINYLTKKNNLSYYEITFLMKYLGYKKCLEEGLKDVEIEFGNFLGNRSSTMGNQQGGVITINKKNIMNSSFVNNTMKSPLTTMSIMNPNTYEGTTLLSVLYHELRHVIQYNDYINQESSDVSYIYCTNAIASIMDKGFYNRNYRLLSIEADADRYAYRQLGKTINEYMNNYNLEKNADFYSKGYANRVRFNYLINKRWKKLITEKYEKDILNEFFKKSPGYLSDMPLFNEFYNGDGSSKKLNQILSNSVIKHDYQYKLIVGSLIEGDRVTKEEFENLRLSQSQILIENISVLLDKVNNRLYSANLMYKNGLSVDDISIRALLKYNIKVDVKFGKVLCNLWNNILNNYPSLIATINENTINEINDLINIFNSNKKILSEDLWFNFEKDYKL